MKTEEQKEAIKKRGREFIKEHNLQYLVDKYGWDFKNRLYDYLENSPQLTTLEEIIWNIITDFEDQQNIKGVNYHIYPLQMYRDLCKIVE